MSHQDQKCINPFASHNAIQPWLSQLSTASKGWQHSYSLQLVMVNTNKPLCELLQSGVRQSDSGALKDAASVVESGNRFTQASRQVGELVRSISRATTVLKSLLSAPTLPAQRSVTIIRASGGAEKSKTFRQGYHRSAYESKAALLPLCKRWEHIKEI